MGHGVPDFGATSATGTVYGMADLGELAARLGSIVTYDRRGDVLWCDDFEDGYSKWEASLSGVGAARGLTQEAVRSGGLAAMLTTGTGENPIVKLAHYHPLNVVGKLGFEYSFAYILNPTYIRGDMTLYDGSSCHDVRWRYDRPNGNLQIFSSAFAWETVANIGALFQSGYMFHTAKLVVDVDNDRYVRLLLDDAALDLSAHALYTDPSTDRMRGEYYINVEGPGDASLDIYVDDVILTQNEP